MLNTDFNKIQKASILNNAIKVMVIDHKTENLAYVGEFLKIHSFEVTCVDQAGAALKMLLEKKDNFDLILIDSGMRDVDIITFLRLIKNMDIISMVMCQEIDDNFLLQVLENGGFRVVKPPITPDVVTNARQDVIRVRVHKFEQLNMFAESGSCQDRGHDGSATRKRTNYISAISLDLLPENVQYKKRVCVEWTRELHIKFLIAYYSLEPGKRYPKAILEAMNVPGLTRLQVASHLQYLQMKRKLNESMSLQWRGIPSSSSDNRLSSNLSEGVDLGMLGDNPGAVTHVENHDQIVTDTDAMTFPSNGGQLNVDIQSFTDLSMIMNGSGFDILGDVHSAPIDSNHNSIPPNQVADDLYEYLCGVDEQILADCDLEIPNQGTSEYIQQIEPQGG